MHISFSYLNVEVLLSVSMPHFVRRSELCPLNYHHKYPKVRAYGLGAAARARGQAHLGYLRGRGQYHSHPIRDREYRT